MPSFSRYVAIALAFASTASAECTGASRVVQDSFLADHPAPMATKTAFVGWMDKHAKSYEAIDTLTQRFQVWTTSLAQVDTHNAREVGYTLGMTEFADMTPEEFSDTYLMSTTGAQDCSATKGNHELAAKDLPLSVDWRTKNVVSPVKSQGKCGSCWTFSSTGALEAHHAIVAGKKIILSEQQLVDCAQNFNNHGCEGGLPSQAFEYILYNGGLDTEIAYPYKAKDEACEYKVGGVGVKVEGVHNITRDSEAELQDAIAFSGPVSIAYEVAADFRLYNGGVYDSKVCHSDPQHVNHAVLAVGYVLPAGDKKGYYIVKNSWGAAWGLDGYFHIVTGKNMCGLATCASYPKVVNDGEWRGEEVSLE